GEGEGAEGEGEGAEGEGEGAEGEGEGAEGEGEGITNCSALGVWDETYQGSSSVDGMPMNGTSKITITEAGGVISAQATDSSEEYWWSGTVTMTADGLDWAWRMDDNSSHGTYDCTFSADCAKLNCTWVTLNQDDSPNSTGTATWTKR
ncbi:MAG: hypothetical protein RBU45_14690, partial [Myxococcota bacterium]|nr:hypothetical protein [Myxococcota bacterium]